MINVVLDMLSFYIFKMDIDLLASNLDEDESYAGLTLDEFIAQSRKEFDAFKAAGVTKLRSFIASKPNSAYTYFGFESPIDETPYSFLLETDISSNMVNAIVGLDGYEKIKNVRTNLAL